MASCSTLIEPTGTPHSVLSLQHRMECGALRGADLVKGRGEEGKEIGAGDDGWEAGEGA